MNVTQIFSNVSGNTIIGLSTKTKVALKGGKKNPMQGRVVKVMRDANVMVFQNKNTNGYANMVARRLEKEGKDSSTFQLSPRVWGHRIAGTPIVEHKDKKYVEVIFLASGEVSYELDGKPIGRDKIVGLEVGESDPSQGGLDNKVIVRTFAEDSITEVKIGGFVEV
jgi:hypothetical protein